MAARFPLPRRVRLRLRTVQAVDGAAIWLIDHRRFRAAELLWDICGLRR